jgi:hypothetical protein
MNLSQVLSVPCKILERGIVGLLLSRKDYEQTQLFIVPPYTFVPDHIHPNVHVEVRLLAGKTELRKAGKRIVDLGGSDRVYNIEAGEPHGFSTFNEPVAFLAKETWLNGVQPTSVEEDWVGDKL